MDLTVRDITRLLNITPETVYHWIKERGLPARLMNEQYHCNRAELLEWAAANKVTVSPRLFRETKGPGQKAALNLAHALEFGGILYDVPGRELQAALQAMVERLPLPVGVNRGALLRMLLARERLGSTGIGEGIAIPHVRNPIVLHVHAPMVILGFLEQPVEFHAIDGKPVSTLFMLITPTIRLHLRLLSQLAFALQDHEVKNVLRQRRSANEILAQFTRIETHLASVEPPARK